MASARDLILSCISKSKIIKWHVKEGESVKKDKVLATYVFTEKVADANNFIVQRKLKAKLDGKVIQMTVSPNEEINRGQVVARIQEEKCEHHTVMKDMCCDCGADLRKDPGVAGELSETTQAAVPVVHNILELKVSVKEAERLARYDEKQLLRARKLVLVVDLDMTVIHTTVEPVPKDTKDVYSFTLPGHPFKYNTKLRPGASKFLESISKMFELHIFTMGSRMYAHTIAKFLDPEGKYFAHRIRSRDEFINSFSKVHDLKALFPCGDHMVVIIDDREDVWNYAPNLITVKPYKFFKVSDINDPFNSKDPATTAPAEDTKKPPDGSIDKNNSEEGSKKTGDEEQKKEDSDGNDKTGDNDEDLFIDLTESEDDGDEESLKSKRNKRNKSKGKATNKDNSEDKTADEVVKVAGEAKKPDPRIAELVGMDNGADLDDYLYYLTEILERIHISFYHTLDEVKSKGGSAQHDELISRFCSPNTCNPDVRVILPTLRRQTLHGCNLVFTGVVPTNIPLEKSRPWRNAVSLGARVTTDIVVKKSPEQSGFFTSHVVAARHGTQKAHRAFRTPTIQLVNPNWLSCCSERWERVDEDLFQVPDINGKSLPPPMHSPHHRMSPHHSDAEGSAGKPNNNMRGGQMYSQNHRGISPLAASNNDISSMSPLGRLSQDDLSDMGREVDELLGSSDDDSNDDDNSNDVNKKLQNSINKLKSAMAKDTNSPTKQKLRQEEEELGSIMKLKRPHEPAWDDRRVLKPKRRKKRSASSSVNLSRSSSKMSLSQRSLSPTKKKSRKQKKSKSSSRESTQLPKEGVKDEEEEDKDVVDNNDDESDGGSTSSSDTSSASDTSDTSDPSTDSDDEDGDDDDALGRILERRLSESVD